MGIDRNSVISAGMINRSRLEYLGDSQCARKNTQAVWIIWIAVPTVFRSEIIPHVRPRVHEHYLLGDNWEREKPETPLCRLYSCLAREPKPGLGMEE
jgi:hypothetical protein